jgi:hypothetical protein
MVGFLNGQGILAKFYKPAGLAVHPSGDLYIADLVNHMIRRLLKATEA